MPILRLLSRCSNVLSRSIRFLLARTQISLRRTVTRLTFVTPEETADLEQKAFAASEKALSLDANLPEAYLARGISLSYPLVSLCTPQGGSGIPEGR